MTLFIRLMPLLLSLGLAACSVPAEMSAPLPRTVNEDLSEKIAGSWYMVGDEKDDTLGVNLRIQPYSDGTLTLVGTLSVITLKQGKNTTGYGWTSWQGETSRLDGQDYVSIRLSDALFLTMAPHTTAKQDILPHLSPHEERGYWIARVSFLSPDEMELALLWEDEVEGPVRKVDCGEDCSFDVHEMTSAGLAKYLSTASASAKFKHRFILHRITDTWQF